jgi:hypothetical protein
MPKFNISLSFAVNTEEAFKYLSEGEQKDEHLA